MPKPTNHKEQIVDAALRLFATRGYASTPISLIAKTAKVSQGLMYNFFKSKEQLLNEMMERGFHDIHKSMTSYDIKGIAPEKAIQMHVIKTIEIIQEHQEFWRLLHSIRLQGKVVTSMKKAFQETVQQVTNTFKVVFKSLGYENPGLEAILFLAQIDGLVILFLQDNSIPLKKLGEQIIKRYTK